MAGVSAPALFVVVALVFVAVMMLVSLAAVRWWEKHHYLDRAVVRGQRRPPGRHR